MISRWIRAAALPAALALAPVPALAFETVDTMLWPSSGRFPAYGADPARPWSIWAYGGAMYDSNVLRTQVDERSDTITRVGLGGRYAARVIGRQAVVLDGYGEYHMYDNFNQLDHFAYGLRGTWLWEIGNDLSGTLGARRTHRLADLGELRAPVKDLVTDDRLDATGAYRFAANWRLTGGVGGSHTTHEGRDLGDANSFGTRAGIEYVSGLGNALGVEVRHTEGEAPVDEILGIGTFPDNEYREDEVALTLSYALAASMRMRGRLGRTERTYTELVGRDFSGTTGRGSVEWFPGAKTMLSFEVYREPDTVIDSDALYVDRRGIVMGIAWAATVKLVFGARMLNERRIYQGDPLITVTGAPLRDETIRIIRFHAGWEPERFWYFSGALDFGNRSSNVLGRDYDYTAVTFNLRYQF
jgi:hypothetical protein